MNRTQYAPDASNAYTEPLSTYNTDEPHIPVGFPTLAEEEMTGRPVDLDLEEIEEEEYTAEIANLAYEQEYREWIENEQKG